MSDSAITSLALLVRRSAISYSSVSSVEMISPHSTMSVHVRVSVVHVVASIVFMIWIPASTCQPYTIVVSRLGFNTGNNNIELSCSLNGTTISGATFYRRNGDSETLLNSNTFIINKITEGFYFCKKDDSRSNEQPINGK